MDRIDKKILSIINKSIPISERPFLAVAEAMGMSEEEVLDRYQETKRQRPHQADRGDHQSTRHRLELHVMCH